MRREGAKSAKEDAKKKENEIEFFASSRRMFFRCNVCQENKKSRDINEDPGLVAGKITGSSWIS
jgi:hypothetical protein